MHVFEKDLNSEHMQRGFSNHSDAYLTAASSNVTQSAIYLQNGDFQEELNNSQHSSYVG